MQEELNEGLSSENVKELREWLATQGIAIGEDKLTEILEKEVDRAASTNASAADLKGLANPRGK